MSKVFTLGHSTRTLEEFVGLLTGHSVSLLVDVRTIPRSKRNPQFNRESLPGSLCAVDVDYRHLKELGGLRRPKPDSANKGWKNLSFRGFADYMLTTDFSEGVEELVGLTNVQRVAIMCAEALPWRCHRWLIADTLVLRGVDVEHIISGKVVKAHEITKWARVQNGKISYPELDEHQQLPR